MGDGEGEHKLLTPDDVARSLGRRQAHDGLHYTRTITMEKGSPAAPALERCRGMFPSLNWLVSTS